MYRKSIRFHALWRGVFMLLGALFLIVGWAAQKAWAFDDDYKETINGTKLHFRVRGADKTNPYLVILHGGPGFSAHMFLPWGASLEKAVNVVYLDQRESGESERTTFAGPTPTKDELKGITVANMVKDIEGVRQFLKVEKWHVLGHSWGGMLGIEYVTAHPDQVLTYIHMDGSLSTPMMVTAILDNAETKFTEMGKSDDANKKTQAQNRLKQVSYLRALPAADINRLGLAFQLALGPAGLYVARPAENAAYNGKIREQLTQYKTPFNALYSDTPGKALALYDGYLTRDVTSLLPNVTVPTLIINGKQDGVITPQSAEIAHKGIKGSQLVILEDCGHFPFAEQPEKATTAILNFIMGQAKK